MKKSKSTNSDHSKSDGEIIAQRYLQKAAYSMYEPEVIWVTEFDSMAVTDFYAKFMALEKDPSYSIIPVFINSYGGDVYALNAMRDLIKSSPKPVSTIAVGAAMSAGACLLAAGTVGFRFAAVDTRIMIHQISGVAPGKAADVMESAFNMADLNSKLMENLSKDSGRSLKTLEKVMKSKHNADWVLSAKEAQDWGFIDAIGIPRLADTPGQSALALIAPFKMPNSKSRKS